jgi:hypothetical protein
MSTPRAMQTRIRVPDNTKLGRDLSSKLMILNGHVLNSYCAML